MKFPRVTALSAVQGFSLINQDSVLDNRRTIATQKGATIPRRVILIVCDGLSVDWISSDATPILCDLMQTGISAAKHRAVFPSVTRVSAASIATGCFPVHHGLHGNQMALLVNDRLTVHNVGHSGFRQTLRQTTGTTLTRPTMAERLAAYGGQVAFSNVSPGAAYFLDPEHYGTVLHRAGSFGPGGIVLSGEDHLDVSHDLAGDMEMSRRFCDEVIKNGHCSLGILWLANPDLTLHHSALGGQAHLAALRVIDSVIESVRSAIADSDNCDQTLLMVGSDHGHETIGASIHLGSWLAAQGLHEELRGGQVAVASQGTSALIYAIQCVENLLQDMLPMLKQQPWVGSVHTGNDLAKLGLDTDGAIFAAIDSAYIAEKNQYGIPGMRWMFEDGESPPEFGCGQHGGMGRMESAPFLIMHHSDISPKQIDWETSLIDIAPTILNYLNLNTEGFDGHSLLSEC